VRSLLALLCMVLLAGCGAAATGPAVEPVSPMPASSPVVVAPPEPVGIAIPRLHVSDEIVPVGICAKAAPPKCSGADELEVPDVHEVGWYRGSPRPGAVGPALLAGHVNWREHPGAPLIAGSFARIGDLRRGDEVIVTSKGGAVHRFVVYAVEQFEKAKYDEHMPALLANTAGPELRLVTCSGDLVGHDYLSNTVVSAEASS
jgi:hypothetical protein